MRGEEGRGEESGWEEERRAREKKESFFLKFNPHSPSSVFLFLSLLSLSIDVPLGRLGHHERRADV